MGEWRLFEEGTIPPHTTPEWYAGRDRAPHVDQAEHRGRLDIAAGFVEQLVRNHNARDLVDLGAGDGGLLSLVAPLFAEVDGTAWGYDLQQSNVEGACERGVKVFYADVVGGSEGVPNTPAAGAISVATEMLEHLVDPHGFVRRIARRSKWLVASSPFTERPGSAYEFHTWAWDLDGYRALVDQAGFEVWEQQTTSMFQVILAGRPGLRP